MAKLFFDVSRSILFYACNSYRQLTSHIISNILEHTVCMLELFFVSVEEFMCSGGILN